MDWKERGSGKRGARGDDVEKARAAREARELASQRRITTTFGESRDRMGSDRFTAKIEERARIAGTAGETDCSDWLGKLGGVAPVG